MLETGISPEPDKIIPPDGPLRPPIRGPGKGGSGVGVYRSPEGRTPVNGGVKAAEAGASGTARKTKGYVGLAGRSGISSTRMRRLNPGRQRSQSRARGGVAARPGGTGAIHDRSGGKRWRRLRPEATVLDRDPTWPNHPAINRPSWDRAGRAKPLYDGGDRRPSTRDGMALADAGQRRRPADMSLLHGCCHKPEPRPNLPLAELAGGSPTL